MGRSVSGLDAVCKHRTNRVFVAGKVICYHQLLGDCGAVSTYNTVMAEVLSPAPAPAPDTDCLVRINNNTEAGESDQVTVWRIILATVTSKCLHYIQPFYIELLIY